AYVRPPGHGRSRPTVRATIVRVDGAQSAGEAAGSPDPALVLGNSLQVFFEKREELLPSVHRLLRAIGGAVVIEEAVSRAVVAMELVRLAVLFELLLVLVHISRGRSLVLVAEQTQERRLEVLRVFDRRHRLLRRQLLFRCDNTTTPQIGDGAETLCSRRCKERVPPTRARAHDA